MVPAPLRAVAEPVKPLADTELAAWGVADAAPFVASAGWLSDAHGSGAGSREARLRLGFGGRWVAGAARRAKRAGLVVLALIAGAEALADAWATGGTQVSKKLSADWVKDGCPSITT